MLFTSPVIADPPVGVVYHLYSPGDPPLAFSVSEADGEQPAAGITPGCMGSGMTVAVTEVRVLSQVPSLMAV